MLALLPANVLAFGMDLGGTGGDIQYGGALGSEFGNAGESLQVGGTQVIPEPSGTGLVVLALGSAGLLSRRRRQD